MRDPFTGEEMPAEPVVRAAAPIERSVRVSVTSVQNERSQLRFIAEAAVGAEHPVAIGETPGEALATLGRNLDALLANHAWDAIVPIIVEEP